jgi:Fe-S cluster assembly protein SufD
MTTTVVSEGVDSLVAAASSLASGTTDRSPLWLSELRKEALAKFEELGLPANHAARASAWEREGAEAALPLSKRRGAFEAFSGLAGVVSPFRSSRQLVFVNGRLDLELSAVDGLGTGIHFGPLSRFLEETSDSLQPHLGLTRGHRSHSLAALNTAMLSEGAVLRIDAGVVAPEPFQVVHVTDPGERPLASHPRLLVILGENAQASIVEAFAGPDAGSESLVNSVAELYLAPHAMLDHTRLQEEGGGTIHQGTLFAHQDRGSQLFSHLFSFGGRITRNELHVALHGEGAGVTVDGLFMAKGEQRVEHKTLIDHARPHCGSQQLFKGVLDGRSRGSFEGKIIVRPNAIKSDAHQKSRNLILSKEALVETQPQLEIYNDDVKCTHGSTTGRLDEGAVFYLRSRGLSEAASRALLTSAFASEIAGRSRVEAVRAYLEPRVLRWFGEEGMGQ